MQEIIHAETMWESTYFNVIINIIVYYRDNSNSYSLFRLLKPIQVIKGVLCSFRKYIQT